MRGLLDTCTLAEIRLPAGNPAVKAFVAGIPDPDLFLSVMSIGEIVKGITLLDLGRKRTALASWLARLEDRFGDRILPVDIEVARLWGEMTAGARRGGVVIPELDGLIAATALRYELHVVTRNTRHFAATGVSLIDPWRGS